MKNQYIFIVVMFWCSYGQIVANLDAQRTFVNIDEVVQFAATISWQASQQPLFTGTGSYVTPCKILPLSYRNNCRIITALHKNARCFNYLPYDCPSHILAVGEGSHQVTADGKQISCGIEVWISSVCMKNNNTPYSLESLYQAYRAVIRDVRSNWKEVLDMHHYLRPATNDRQDDDSWFLLTKKRCLLNEEFIIHFLLGALQCDTIALIRPKPDITQEDSAAPETLYLWIKKSAFKRFQKIFAIEFLAA
ncbi:hypothetical protein M1466_03210 [Candidatus Dependentiae bacterium]|nr:hypothetical protein [Candidatus Dependentiae bacterium]